MKRKFLLPLALCGFIFTSCGGNNSSSVLTSSKTETSISTSSSSEEVETSSSLENGKKEYVFEAEWSEGIEDMTGYGYSGTTTGLNMIQPDSYSKGASNGYYVSYLYNYGMTLTWHITASTALEKVAFTARFAAEYVNFSITSSEYMITVNGSPIGYQTITFDNVPTTERIKMVDFEDYLLNENVSLQEGENEIKFITNNSKAMTGTMYATAPVVDCFKLVTEGELTWDPVTSNTDY